MMKKLSILSILFVALTFFSSTNITYAKDWGMTLSPFCIAGGENQNYKTKENYSSPYISLTRIVGGPS